MHKDKPPGWFEFNARSVRHAVWMGISCGVALSFVVHFTLMVVANADTKSKLQGGEAAKVDIDQQVPPKYHVQGTAPAVKY